MRSVLCSSCPEGHHCSPRLSWTIGSPFWHLITSLVITLSLPACGSADACARCRRRRMSFLGLPNGRVSRPRQTSSIAKRRLPRPPLYMSAGCPARPYTHPLLSRYATTPLRSCSASLMPTPQHAKRLIGRIIPYSMPNARQPTAFIILAYPITLRPRNTATSRRS